MEYEKFKDKAFSAFGELAREYPAFEDVRMLVAASEATASLVKNDVCKEIDTKWIDAIEKALPSLDAIVRNPTIAIEDIDEVLPVELSRHITEKSIKHLAQHTNLILDVREDDVIPQKILNVYHDETFLTYENKFINTLLLRLYAFVDKRYKVLVHSSGKEQNYSLSYATEFEHYGEGGRSTARVSLEIALTTPSGQQAAEQESHSYAAAVERIVRINAALMSYRTSVFSERMGKNYIRPPIIRTNAILKNKDMKECLTLWEFIEGFDKVGYTVTNDAQVQMPADRFITELYSSVALQYVDFYNGVTQSDETRLLSQKQLFENEPEFAVDISEEDIADYTVYDSEYKKSVPVSRLLNNRKTLSEDEKRIAEAITVALKADALYVIEQERLRELRKKEREEKRRAEKERQLAQEQERQRLEQEAQKAREAEESRRAMEEKRAKLLEKAKAKKGRGAPRPGSDKNAYTAKNNAKAARSKKEKLPEFTFAGEPVLANIPVLPCTRESYSGMSRKKKKRIVADALKKGKQ